jgi:outer membrane PBP1 activator LpoA protein
LLKTRQVLLNMSDWITQLNCKRLVVFACAALLAACGGTSAPVSTAPPQPAANVTLESDQTADLNWYLRMAAATSSPEAEQYILQASAIALQNGDADNAAAILAGIESTADLPLTMQVTASLQRVELELLRNDYQRALTLLNGSPFDSGTGLSNEDQARLMQLRSQTYLAMEQYLAAARELTRLATLLPASERATNNNRVWQILSSAPAGTLSTQRHLVDSYELRGWLELANVVNDSQNNIELQVRAVSQWQNRWNQHSAAATLPDALAFAAQLLNNRPMRIALMLPLGDAAGRAVSDGFMAAYYDAVSQNQQTPQVIVIDTSEVTDILPAYQRTVESGVDMIIGPLRKDSVRQLQAMTQLPIPTLALNYGDEGLINPQNLYQFGLAPEDEIAQAARLAWQAGHRYAAVLTPAGEEYRRIQENFVQYWESLGGEIVTRATFGSAANYSNVIRRLTSVDHSEARASSLRSALPRSNLQFTPRRRQDIDFMFVLANPAEGRQLKPTMAFHFAGDIPVFAMPAIYDGGVNVAGNRDLNGIVFVDAPWILSNTDPLKANTFNVWADASGPVQRLRAMGVDSFRLHSRIAQLANFPGIRLQGATGVLSMRPDGSINRELIGAQIVNGEAVIMVQDFTGPGVAAGRN